MSRLVPLAKQGIVGAALQLAVFMYSPVASGDDSLLVMLQGADLEQISASAERYGAVITHRLPIINALGARMSPAQLDLIKKHTKGIDRVIDDLAWTPEPEAPNVDQCPLKSAIELTWVGNRATWVLFNKSSMPLHVSMTHLEWPEELGSLNSAQWNSATLDLPTNTAQRSISWSTSIESLEPKGRVELSFGFENSPRDHSALQNQITLTAEVNADCGAKLVPSYPEPESDSYYPSASGAALLHSHGITGRGVTVAVLDSGLWEENAELTLDTEGKERIVARYDAIKGHPVSEAFDESGHGTHMTSVLARSGDVKRSGASLPSYRGIAPDVNLAVVKAFGESGKAGFLDIVRGVQWVVENKERLNIRVLNLSFAARPRWPYWEDPVNQALMQAWRAGIFIAAAAGNEGPEPMTVGSPGNLPYLLTVGAVTDSWTENERNDDFIPDFSSRGPTPMGHIKPDLVAMGGHISGIIRPGSTLSEQLPEFLLASGEFVMTGTSQATALVSGLAALMLQIEPELSNDDLKCMMVSSAEPAIELDGRFAYSPFTQGKGMINIQRALTVGTTSCEQESLDINADIGNDQHFQGPAVFEAEAPPYLPGQADVISDVISEKGLSDTRRWGIEQHLERLKEEPINSPIDWLKIYNIQQRRLQGLATEE